MLDPLMCVDLTIKLREWNPFTFVAINSEKIYIPLPFSYIARLAM